MEWEPKEWRPKTLSLELLPQGGRAQAQILAGSDMERGCPQVETPPTWALDRDLKIHCMAA